MNVIGLDPGKTGALARYGATHNTLEVIDVPTFEVIKARKKSNRVDAVKLAHHLQTLAARGCDLIVLEQPMAMPGQASQSVFDIGRSFGMLEGIIASLRIRYEIVAPLTWKRALKVPAAKDGALARASQLLPQHAHLWPLKKHDGRAEAALIALYGAEHLLASTARQPEREPLAAGEGCTQS